MFRPTLAIIRFFFHPKELYAVKVFIQSMRPRIDVEISSSIDVY